MSGMTVITDTDVSSKPLFTGSSRDEIMQILRASYLSKTKTDLPIYGVVRLVLTFRNQRYSKNLQPLKMILKRT